MSVGAVGVGGSGWRVVMRAGGPPGEVMIPDGGSGGTPPSIDGPVQFDSDDLKVVFLFLFLHRSEGS